MTRHPVTEMHLVLQTPAMRFVSAARQADLPVTEFTQPEGRHAFDVLDDTNDSRDAIRQIVDFLGEHLLR